MVVQRTQKTLFFDSKILSEYIALCEMLGFRISLRMEHYMKKDLALLRSYAKRIKV